MRKRVIKLLKTFYTVTEDYDRQVDICKRLALRMLDEDDTVKVSSLPLKPASRTHADLSSQELAIKTLEEIWFSNTSDANSKRGVQDDKTRMRAKVEVMMNVNAQFKDNNSPLEDMLHRVWPFPAFVSTAKSSVDHCGQGGERCDRSAKYLHGDV